MEPFMTILLCLLAVGYSFQLVSVPLKTQDEVWESMMHNDHDGHIYTKRPKTFVDPSSCSIESCGGRRNVTLWKQETVNSDLNVRMNGVLKMDKLETWHLFPDYIFTATKQPFHVLSESPGLLIINHCDHGRCGNIYCSLSVMDTLNSIDVMVARYGDYTERFLLQIGRWFQDIFYTREEIANLNQCLISPKKCNNSTNQSLSLRPPSQQQLNRETLTGSLDYDQCCVTSRSVQTVSGMMTDIYNKQYTVVSYNNQDNQIKYQISYVGICAPNNPSGCSGTCRQETGIDSFLCFDEFMKVGFRLFYSNSYCSCKAN